MATRQIILDTETTGLSVEEGHRLIEIGCLEMIDRRLTGNYFHHYVNPERDIDKAAQVIHGISREFLKDKPLFRDIQKELAEYLKDAELIIHNAPFDIQFINAEYRRIGESFAIADYCSIIDTLILARRKHPGQSNKLDALCVRYKVNNTNRKFHGALLDAELLSQVYLAMTGGQEQLFAEPKLSVSDIESIIDVQSIDLPKTRVPVLIIRADAAEQEAHEKFLKMLRKKGHCLWDQEPAISENE